MAIPLDKLVDLTEGKYKVAKAAMNKIIDLSSMNIREETGEKLAVYILRRILEDKNLFTKINSYKKVNE